MIIDIAKVATIVKFALLCPNMVKTVSSENNTDLQYKQFGINNLHEFKKVKAPILNLETHH